MDFESLSQGSLVTKRGEITRGEIYQGFQLINNKNRHNLAKSRHFRNPQKELKTTTFCGGTKLQDISSATSKNCHLVKKISNSGSPETPKTFENNDSKGN